MVDYAINLATGHDKGIRIQLIKVAVVDSCRGTVSGKMHASIVSMGCCRPISERKARQAERLGGLEYRVDNSGHITAHVGTARPTTSLATRKSTAPNTSASIGP